MSVQIVKPRILMIDDEEFYAGTIVKALEDRGFEATYRTTGIDIATTIISFNPDLILLDIMMPDISGLTVLKELRRTFKALDLPILILSAKREDDDIITGLELGANDYLAKPIDLDICIARIKTQLAHVRLSRDAIRSSVVDTLEKTIVTFHSRLGTALVTLQDNLHANIDTLKQENVDEGLAAANEIVETMKQIRNFPMSNSD